ncbi:SIR2 family protein [Cupriavidus pauculus]|uniref:SIR2 family protein n=1 Tax=Cupriavidus pauculus TaxID=82633 RepID=UPI001FD0795D|nr:SIR2 family protein [Cupriavidus pauculus]
MRFTPNGPSIPDELLTARDAGDVLFFCGAGVSKAGAGLPDFYRLAEMVMDELGAIQTSPPRQVFAATRKLQEEIQNPGIGGLVAADRLFSLLERDFDATDVRAAVAKSLKPVVDSSSALTPHRTLLDLSRGPTGEPRLVTTNFDLLFEQCDASLPQFSPPHLPDPRRDQDFRGIIHLHGRVNDSYTAAHDNELVMSSADFGYAYLSEGWATRYINLLLQRYQIVFVGYSADDPPIQYLLEALNRFSTPGNAMYAFQSGDKAQAGALWSHKGVTPISYSSDNQHAALWESLEQWSIRARDVDAWHDAVLHKAISGPTALEPHERGMVAHLASTMDGASRIAAAEDPIPAEWLFVFDRNARYFGPPQEARISLSNEGPPFFDAVCLDSDEPPVRDEDLALNASSLPSEAWDAFVLNRADIAGVGLESVGGWRDRQHPALPHRLRSLQNWLLRVSHQPSALIWAAGIRALHPDIIARLQNRLRFESVKYSPKVLGGWQFVLAALSEHQSNPDQQKYAVEGKASVSGWTASLVQDAMRVYRPALRVEPSYGVSALHGSDEQELIHVSLEYERPHSEIDIPPHQRSYALSLLRQEIERAVRVEREINPDYPSYLHTLVRNDGAPGDRDSYGITGHVVAYVEMLFALAEDDPASARREVSHWGNSDDISTRIKVVAASKPELASPEEAGSVYLDLTDVDFWGDEHERDLLISVKARWPELEPNAQAQLTDRILNGEIPYDHVSDEIKARCRLGRIQWLKENGIDIEASHSTEVRALLEQVPDWTEDAAFYTGRPKFEVFSVSQDTALTPLEGVPLADIVEKVEQIRSQQARHLHTVSEPFLGLVNQSPSKALRALVLALKKGIYQPWTWATLLNRDQTSHRLVLALAARLARLSAYQLRQVVREAANWLWRNRKQLDSPSHQLFWELWQACVESLRSGPVDDTGKRRRNWVEESVDSTAARLAESAFSVDRDLDSPVLLPELEARIEQLLQLPSPFRQHAVFRVAMRFDVFFAKDRKWTTETLLPLSSAMGDDSAAFWQGYLYRSTTLSPRAFALFKDDLIRHVRDKTLLKAGRALVAGTLLDRWLQRTDVTCSEETMSDTELREILVLADEEFRDELVRTLARWAKEAPTKYEDQVLYFLEKVWPLQKIVKNARMTARLVDLAFAVSDRFSEAVKLIVPKVVVAPRELSMRYYKVDERVVQNHGPALVELLWQTLPTTASMWPDDVDHLLTELQKLPTMIGSAKLSTLLRRSKYRR